MRDKKRPKRDWLALLLLISLFFFFLCTLLAIGSVRTETGPLHGTIIGFLLVYLLGALVVIGGLVLIRKNRSVK